MKSDIFLGEGKLLVRVEDRFILDQCEPLREAVLAALGPSVSHVLFDLSKTDFIDSAGLATLVAIKMKANETKARLTLLNPSPPVEDVLVISKLNQIFEIASGLEAEKLAGSLASPENLVRTIGEAEEKRGFSSADDLKIKEPEEAKKGPDASKIVNELCRSAVEAFREGKYEESIRFYRQALDIDPENLSARNNLAIVFEKRPEWRKNAIEQWEIVLQLSEKLGDEKHKERAERHLEALRL